jgi:hypothetical protein
MYSLAGRYPIFDNPIPTRFLAPIDCLKIPARICIFNQGHMEPRGEGAIYKYLTSQYLYLIRAPSILFTRYPGVLP